MELTGLEWTALLKQGDLAAYEKVFKALYGRLHAYAFITTQNSHLAEDAVQQVFCRIWQQRRTLNINTSPQAYLYTAVYNECLLQLKKQQRRKKMQVHISQHTPALNNCADAKLAASEFAVAFQDALSYLPEQCRTVFQLNRMEHLKYREVAVRLGISEKTVENQMGKALKLLRQYLSEFLTIIMCLLCNW